MTDQQEPEHQAILDAERAVNEEYLREIEDLLRRQPGIIREISILQSQRWTTAALPHPGVDRGAVSPLIGRVALEDGHPYADFLPDTFYVASWRVEGDDFETVNWTAPVASLFFEGPNADYELAPSLLGRRTFVRRLGDLIDFQDDVETPGDAPFARRARELEVPTAPARRATSSPSEQTTDQTREAGARTPAETDDGVQEPTSTTSDAADQRPAEPPLDLAGRIGGLRAAEAVLKVMEMPKTGRMGSVLPTMQPDQYELVSWDASTPLIVQGQPGTGKTVIGAHRAVYLTSEERKDKRIARIAIVGPSDHYVDHVAPVVAELKEPGAEIRLQSLPALLKNIVDLPGHPKAGPIGRIESSWELGRAVESIVRALPNRPAKGPMPRRVRTVVESLKTADLSRVDDAELRDWLRHLPSWSELSSQVRYLPMLATIALALAPRSMGEAVGHLIVDEAQDVRPLEWRILTHSLLEPRGGVTLLGDMNQRRSDWTEPSWKRLAEVLELTDENGDTNIEEIEKGFRSTRQILRFANRLLPTSERTEGALRDGPTPRDVPASNADGLTVTAVDTAADLSSRHEGTVAIIATKPTPFYQECGRRGWVRGRFQHSWTRGDRTIVVLDPDEARGLEFDGVVVVEPADFPENVGRQGVLYTSLTRANTELAVVHAKPLPKELRMGKAG